MNRFTKKDLFFASATGFYTGLIAWRILVFLEKSDFMGISFAWLIVFVPVLWILGVNLGYFLGRWISFFNQFGKYAAIGFTNFVVDTGVVNLLIASSGIASGLGFSVFKSLSFVVAVTHSYLWNRLWVFESKEGQKKEFIKFMTVNLVAITVNVGVASFVVNYVNPIYGFDPKTWANVGVVIGSAVSLIFSFVGFKLVVFKGSSQKLEQ
ncbi:MAG: GtrA family protein [bacterium]|nr:GtrA family protein [bacterium]MDO8496433.1 GtrA family protein [bacterium]